MVASWPMGSCRCSKRQSSTMMRSAQVVSMRKHHWTAVTDSHWPRDAAVAAAAAGEDEFVVAVGVAAVVVVDGGGDDDADDVRRNSKWTRLLLLASS